MSFARLSCIDAVEAFDWAVAFEASVLGLIRAVLGMGRCCVFWMVAEVAADIVGRVSASLSQVA